MGETSYEVKKKKILWFSLTLCNIYWNNDKKIREITEELVVDILLHCFLVTCKNEASQYLIPWQHFSRWQGLKPLIRLLLKKRMMKFHLRVLLWQIQKMILYKVTIVIYVCIFCHSLFVVKCRPWCSWSSISSVACVSTISHWHIVWGVYEREREREREIFSLCISNYLTTDFQH